MKHSPAMLTPCRFVADHAAALANDPQTFYPRYLTWRGSADGLLVTSDRARWIIRAGEMELGLDVLKTMVRPELKVEVSGSC